LFIHACAKVNASKTLIDVNENLLVSDRSASLGHMLSQNDSVGVCRITPKPLEDGMRAKGTKILLDQLNLSTLLSGSYGSGFLFCLHRFLVLLFE
jgi:hypothetical protein